MARLLVVEDDPALLALTKEFLERAGHKVAAYPSAVEGYAAFSKEKFDMIVTDVMLPGMDGFAFARLVREQDKEIPILFETAKDDKLSETTAFSVGVDDYVTKPFDPDILVLRVEAILRRARIGKEKKLTSGNLVMDGEEHSAYVDGVQIPLTVREFDILFRLLSFPKKTFTRSRLMEEFWDFDTSATSRTVDVSIAKIREKTAACTGFEIVTVHGLGYKAVLK